ncbi:MAG: hypothetical protein AAFN77_08785 [Planctomycetota bacterium]
MSTNRTSFIGLVLVVLAVVTSTGCQRFAHCGWFPFGASAEIHTTSIAPPSIPIAIDPRFQHAERDRVLLISSGFDQSGFPSNQSMIDELQLQFQKSGLQEAIAPRNVEMKSHTDEILVGKFNEYEMVELARAYNADTIALVRVNELSRHAPLRLGVTVAFVDCNESYVFCSVDYQWDLAENSTRWEFNDFLSRMTIPDYEREISCASPRLVMQFASEQLVHSLELNGY